MYGAAIGSTRSGIRTGIEVCRSTSISRSLVIMAMSIDQRMREARKFERTVFDVLRSRGWTADPFGQGQLSQDIRAKLRQVKTPVRWMPDIIGCKIFPYAH